MDPKDRQLARDKKQKHLYQSYAYKRKKTRQLGSSYKSKIGSIDPLTGGTIGPSGTRRRPKQKRKYRQKTHGNIP